MGEREPAQSGEPSKKLGVDEKAKALWLMRDAKANEESCYNQPFRRTENGRGWKGSVIRRERNVNVLSYAGERICCFSCRSERRAVCFVSLAPSNITGFLAFLQCAVSVASRSFLPSGMCSNSKETFAGITQ